METIAFLGSSKGLGRAVAEFYSKEQEELLSLLVARSELQLKKLAEDLGKNSIVYPFDLSKVEELEPLILQLERQQVERIFYFAGGGPFGLYSEKEWKDHQWGLNVTLLTPARLLLNCLSRPGLKTVRQFVCIGSQLADSQADPFSASYATAKHGLKGLVESLAAEKHPVDIRLFRPGYMDTSLLPKNAAPRKQGSQLASPQEAAKIFALWANDPSGSAVFDLPV